MLDPKSQSDLKDAIGECIGADANVLDELRKEIRPLKALVRRIQPRATTSISLVGTDGGNNQLQFDPFLIQMIRVVDSSDNQYCLEVVSPTTPVSRLVRRHLDERGKPISALGEMMSFLGVEFLPELSPMIRSNDGNRPVSPSWVQVYRELVEWAILFALLKKDFGTDTLIVCDGLLRSKVFARIYLLVYAAASRIGSTRSGRGAGAKYTLPVSRNIPRCSLAIDLRWRLRVLCRLTTLPTSKCRVK